jgi:hypothetical protein
MSKAARLAEEAAGIFEQADKEGRALTGDERAYVQDLLSRAEEHQAAEPRLKELGVNLDSLGGLGPVSKQPNVSFEAYQSPGEVFVRSEEYKSIRDASARSADYFPQQQTAASQVRYVLEGTATSTAAGVAEGAAKPEATLGYTEVSERSSSSPRSSR